MEKQIPLLDLRAQHSRIRDEVLAEVIRVIDSQKFIMGEDVEKLEREIAAYSHARFGVGCASGSDALYLALLGVGIRPGDEVLTTPYSFFATAGAIHRAGAVPVFVDVEAGTFNMDVNQAAAVLAAHPKVKAIVPIHLFGGCADMDPLCGLARDRGILIIEDAAQSIGSEYHGRRAGSMGAVGCFSFFPTKNLGGYGDGGMLTTNDPALGERLAALRVHGSKRKYYHDWVGINSRLDTLQAAVLRVKFRHLDGWTRARQENAALYRKLLAEMNLPVAPPIPAPYQTRHIYNQFCIVCPRREELRAYLNENGIGTEIYYPLPLHLQVCFADLGYQAGDFPVSERLAKESLALPIHPELSGDDIEQICRVMKGFYA
ncbi:MAG: DegT/DnrJ/EryC1/StrS family aminotransferase [Acidobacteriia bacterium]|nr:DegT/DnrJ/EryC1/StrS family aminotransferase [Terriglobia bacterium]